MKIYRTIVLKKYHGYTEQINGDMSILIQYLYVSDRSWCIQSEISFNPNQAQIILMSGHIPKCIRLKDSSIQ